MAGLTEYLPKIAVAIFLIGGGAVLISKITGVSSSPSGMQTVNVTVPTLAGQARSGSIAFNENCAACHGANGSGSDKGPPLVHDIYNPGHHGDESIYRAINGGVKQHHWPFGNMPPQRQVNSVEAGNIVAYIREVQRANGIVYREHRM